MQPSLAEESEDSHMLVLLRAICLFCVTYSATFRYLWLWFTRLVLLEKMRELTAPTLESCDRLEQPESNSVANKNLSPGILHERLCLASSHISNLKISQSKIQLIFSCQGADWLAGSCVRAAKQASAYQPCLAKHAERTPRFFFSGYS